MLNLTQRTNNSVQLPEEVDKALFLNDEGKLVLKDQDGVIEEVNTGNSGGDASYLVYTALLTQTGTNAPVATVLENTLGFTPTWEYQNVGRYYMVLIDTPEDKVFIPTPYQDDIQESMTGFRIASLGDDGFGNTTIALQQCDLSTYGSPVEFDGFTSSPQFEIRVYP